MGDLIKMSQTHTMTELKDDTFTLKITGLPYKDTDQATMGMLTLVMAYDSLEAWVKEKLGEGCPDLPAVVAEARSKITLKSKYGLTKRGPS